MSSGNVAIERPPNHNPEAVLFAGRHYDTIRHKQVRNHNNVYHQFNEVPPLHIPVELDGVVP